MSMTETGALPPKPEPAAPPSRICVFCGSSSRVDPRFKELAVGMGRALATAGLSLVYGGGRVGLMGLIADAVLEGGGRVTGVIPRFLHDFEVAHDGVTDLVVTDSMHDRKRRMYEASDAFVILPGGLGTLDETMEVLTWTQLGLSGKPVIVCNAEGFWQPLLDLIDHTIAQGFTRPENRDLFQVVDRLDQVVPALLASRAVSSDPSGKWV